MIGKARLRNWFQRPVSVTARATSRATNPQRRSIAYEVATPAASPPGTTIESAVETCVTVIAWPNESPGSATIHGGAKVSRLTSVAREEKCDPLPRQVLHERPDLAVVRDRREDEGERRDDDAEAEGAEPEPLKRASARSAHCDRRLCAMSVTLPGPGGRDARSPCSGEHPRRGSG